MALISAHVAVPSAGDEPAGLAASPITASSELNIACLGWASSFNKAEDLAEETKAGLNGWQINGNGNFHDEVSAAGACGLMTTWVARSVAVLSTHDPHLNLVPKG